MLKLSISFTCVVLAFLCMWMEVGPYSFIANLLGGASGSYSTTFADLGTLLVFLTPASLVFASDPVLREPKWKARIMPRFLAVMAACAVGFGGFGWFQFNHPRSPHKVSGIREAARLAGFTPTDVTTDGQSLVAEWERAYSIERTKNGRVDRKESFIPLNASEWPAAELPVILSVSESMVGDREKPKFTGEISVIKKPVPYLLRKAHVAPESARFAVFVNPEKAESSYWLIAAIMSGVGLIGIAIFWMRRRKEWNPMLMAG